MTDCPKGSWCGALHGCTFHTHMLTFFSHEPDETNQCAEEGGSENQIRQKMKWFKGTEGKNGCKWGKEVEESGGKQKERDKVGPRKERISESEMLSSFSWYCIQFMGQIRGEWGTKGGIKAKDAGRETEIWRKERGIWACFPNVIKSRKPGRLNVDPRAPVLTINPLLCECVCV